jgi:uncharacterized membrane protein YfcA
MYIYLPIAQISVNALYVIGIGGAVGFLSGVFGVGGGFLMTPLLIFLGIPPAVAVSTGANQIIASSVTGVLAHLRRGNVDIRMGLLLLIGGLIGSSVGVWIFTALRALGQIDLTITLSFVILLGSIGTLMLVESIQTLRSKKRSGGKRRKKHKHTWLHGLPFKMRFPKSQLYISALLPVMVGIVIGIISAIMGVGGGFIMIPAMIYILGMPTAVVFGTSLFQMIIVASNITFLQSTQTQTVDIVLATLLVIGGVIGAPIGVKVGSYLKGEQLRGLLALIVLLVCLKLVFELTLHPRDLFTIAILG